MSTDRRTAVAVAAVLAAGLGFAAPGAVGASEPKQTLFVITDQEGYGTGECLERQGGCGKVIADSFCESKGFRASAFHRRAGLDDITGATAGGRPAPAREPLAFVIGCR
jgi:hypothetical protein